MSPRLQSWVACVLFFLSGTAALIYQTSWHRLLAIFVGGDLQAVTLIISAFMLGLGSGSVWGGWMADRASAAKNLLLFGMAEALVGLWGWGSEWFYYELLCQQLGALTGARFTSSVLVVLSLLPPTFLMGMSLPLLSRALIQRAGRAAVSIGLLYGVNTLGAAAGAALSTWCLFPLEGISGSLRIAASLNFLCLIGVLIWLPFLNKDARIQAAEIAKESIPPISSRMLGYCILHGITGFLALGLEIVWFRILGVMLKSTAFTLGTLLAIYLAGMGIGALAGAWRVSRHPNPLRLFLWMQAALALYAGASVMLVIGLIEHASWCQNIFDYLASYEPLDVNTSIEQIGKESGNDNEAPTSSLFFILHGVIPLILMFPPTFLMGMSYPYLQKAVQTDPAQIGMRLGWLQAANITGSIAGTFLVASLFIPWLGSAGTLEWLVILGSALGLAALAKTPRPMGKALLWLALTFTTLLAIPQGDVFWATLHGSTTDKFSHVEDGTGVTVLKPVTHSTAHLGDALFFVNGIGQSWLPYGGIHSILGALPALLHPRPESIAIIGLGSGDTAFSAAARYETEQVTCAEIISGQIEALRQHQAILPSPSIQALLAEKKIHHLHADGRRFLMMTQERFDIIETDALRANSAGSGTLYSEEYYHLIQKRLKPGGYAVTWVPTPRVRDTFIRTFPYVLDFGHILIGSMDPIKASADDLRRRSGHLEIRNHFRLAGVPIQRLLAPYLQLDFSRHLIGPETDRKQLGDINTDLNPKDEFGLHSIWKRQKEALTEMQTEPSE